MQSTRWILNTTRPKQQGRVPMAIDGISMDAEHLLNDGLEKKPARAPSKIGIGWRVGKWQYLFNTYVISYICKYLSADKVWNGKGTTWKKDILHYQISCTRTLVVSHWPLCPVGPQPRIKVGSSCKSSSSSCDAKVTKVKIFTGHLCFFFRWMLPLWDRHVFWFRGSPLFRQRQLER